MPGERLARSRFPTKERACWVGRFESFILSSSGRHLIIGPTRGNFPDGKTPSDKSQEGNVRRTTLQNRCVGHSNPASPDYPANEREVWGLAVVDDDGSWISRVGV
ncbi:hypothetical protein N7462_008676 [Penicillium macrosclerotiorum]|uniref:uncharacterized protein n=1 Tax=Penicillium macrosclerotiorum TaxID=303699 RepID=UPI0025473FC4|nr:uncharacterized protein N7462_008676 [Penicillium macrosclerotiorum]KAJ5675779.1 hypothetical protein N7462_008676 [Penicillium macrosclerotiorum]